MSVLGTVNNGQHRFRGEISDFTLNTITAISRFEFKINIYEIPFFLDSL